MVKIVTFPLKRGRKFLKKVQGCIYLITPAPFRIKVRVSLIYNLPFCIL